MKINKAGLELIKRFEGCKLTVYADLAGLPTVGYGHMDRTLKLGDTITQDQAEALLMTDLAHTQAVLTRCIKSPVTDNQFSAMCSLAYNIGTGNFMTSTLLKLVNAEEYTEASDQFLRWDMLGKQVSKGLINRRIAEKRLFLLA